jgi:UDP-glucose:glycoprotein glucosyltransferase
LDFGADLACDFVRRSGRPTPGAFLNGVPLKWDSVDDFEEVVLNQLLREAQAVQIEAYNGRVNEDTDIFEYLMKKPHVLTRLNDKILDTSSSKIFSFGTESWSDLGKQFRDPLANIANSISYLQPTGKKTLPVTVTMWLFSDLETEEGRNFLLNAVDFFVESATHARFAFISSADKLSSLTRDVNDALSNGDVKAIKRLLSSEDYGDTSDSVRKFKSFYLYSLVNK